MYKSNPSKSSWKYFFGFRVPKTGGSKQTGSASDSIVDIVEFKNGWYNNSGGDDANDDYKVLEAEYKYFKHNKHTSWLFDIDTMHDTINPHKMPVDTINDFLVKGVKDIKKEEIPPSQSVSTLREKIKTATILKRNDIDILDDKYTIVKDYGPGSHLLTLDCLIDSASTPSIKKFLKKKGDFFNIQERGSCIDKNTTNGPKPRTFDLTQSTKSCVDNNSSISGVDISLYKYLNGKYPEFFPASALNREKNLILLNYIWQLNLYYCISKCVKPENPSKYSKALLILNRLAFTEFEKTPGSFVPKFSYKNKPEAISAIQKIFLDELERENYVKDNIETQIGELNEKKQFVFNISQAEVAKHIINILQKRNLNDNSMAYNAANIISRNDGENVKDKDKTIKVLTNYYFKFFGERKDDSTYVQYIFMLRLLKFMGDRSHIVMAKLVEKASGEDDDILSPILYTGERPLQVSSINEGLNTVMQHVSVHNQLDSPAESKDFLFCNSGLKPKEFSKLVCSKIISAFCWYYVKTNGNEPSDNYTIINTITSTSPSHSISLKITFNKDNIVYIDFLKEKSPDPENSIKFFTGDAQKKALSRLETVKFIKGGEAIVQNSDGLISQISIEDNVPTILTDFFEQTPQSDNDNINDMIYKSVNNYNDYKVINNIEFGDMFTEFYGNTIKKLSGKKHLLELRRWIFQMLSINDKRPRGDISITETQNNPKAAFFYFLCTSEEFGQGRSTLLILNTLEKALKQLKTLYDYDKKQETNPLLKQKAKNAYEDLCFKLSSIKPVVDLFHAVNLKVNLSAPEVKDKIKCDIDDERKYNNLNDLNNKLNENVYLFNTEFKDVLNRIPNNNSSIMTFRTETGEWNKYCCNPTLLSKNGIKEEGNTNYMTRNPIYGSDSEQQKNNNNCVVNHDSRLNIYNKLLDIRELFYTSQLFKTDSAKEEIENIQKETIVEEVCFDAIGNNSEIIQAVLSARDTSVDSVESALSNSPEFILSSDTKTKIDVNYKNLFDKISENYDYYKSDEITLDERKKNLIELGKRFFRKGYEFYKMFTLNEDEGTVPLNEGRVQHPPPGTPEDAARRAGPRRRTGNPASMPAVGGNKTGGMNDDDMRDGSDSSDGSDSTVADDYDHLKNSEWNEIKNHFLFNCIVEYLINVHFEKYLKSNGTDIDIINTEYWNNPNIDSNIQYSPKKLNDTPPPANTFSQEVSLLPTPKMSDLDAYIDLFDSHIYSIPITMDFKSRFKRDATQANKSPVNQPPVNQPPVDNTSEKGSGTPNYKNKDQPVPMDTVDKKIQEEESVKKDPPDSPLRKGELEFSQGSLPPDPDSQT
tara:strand:- start:3473 stop:7450 length:3978 start_codon:yes stop_codon:yes gene_type:complete